MAGAVVRARPDIEVTFEIYVRQRRRWLIHGVVEERNDALKLGQELARERGIEAVRVVRDELDRTTGQSMERVIFDTEVHVAEAPRPPPPRSEPRPRRRPRPEPEIRPRVPPPLERDRSPAVPLSLVLTIALAALGVWLLGSAG